MRIVKDARGIEWESKALVQGPAQVCSRLLICMIIDCYSALRTINEDLIKLPTIYKALNASTVDDCLNRLSTPEKFKVCPASGY